MSVVEELIRKEDNGTLSFEITFWMQRPRKRILSFRGFVQGKTFKEITKLEKNGLFVYESVPGSTVTDFKNDGEVISFTVEAAGDLGFTLELEPSQEYKVLLEDVELGKMKTNLGGKLNVSIELDEGKKASVKVIKC